MSKPNNNYTIGLIQHQPKKTTLKTALKELTKPKSAIMTELEAEVPGKITKVRSCSDCCMESNPDGTPNTVGTAFRKEQTRTVTNVHGTMSYINCQNCPINKNMTDDEWQDMLNDIDGTE